MKFERDEPLIVHACAVKKTTHECRFHGAGLDSCKYVAIV
jgi:hypothetical protein